MDATKQQRVAEEGDKSHKSVERKPAEAEVCRVFEGMMGEAPHGLQSVPARTVPVAVSVLSEIVFGGRVRVDACMGGLHRAQQCRSRHGKQHDKDKGDGMLQHDGEHAKAAQCHRANAEALYNKRFAEWCASLQPEIEQQWGRE